MPQFVVPQFIDVEDKIIGPITVKQFVIGLAFIMLIFLAYKLSDTTLFIIEAVVFFGLYILIAFIKINGQPTYVFILNLIKTLTKPGLRLWIKKPNLMKNKTEAKEEKVEEEDVKPLPRKLIAQDALSSLSLLVDTGGKYKPEELLKKQAQSKEDAKLKNNTKPTS
jgi:predicted membrane protein